MIIVKCLDCQEQFYGSETYNYTRCPFCYKYVNFHFWKILN